MSLGSNLQFLRKRENMTQEQLAETLGVSRQSISKWESDGSFPETEKILQICEMFHCNMDTLMRGSLEEVSVEDTARYDEHMNRFSKLVAFGVGILIMGVAMQCFLSGLGAVEKIADMMVLIFAAIGVFMLIVGGLDHNSFCHKYPAMKQFYSEQEIEKFDRKFPFLIGGGVTLIIIGIIIQIGFEDVALPVGLTEELFDGIFMAVVSVAVCVMTYAGLQKSKYDIKSYNEENEKEKKPQSKKIGKWCGVIMLIATILFIASIGVTLADTGMKWNGWQGTIMAWSWIVFPIGGIICGIVSIILSKEE